VSIFLDDIILWSTDPETHKRNLMRLFAVLSKEKEIKFEDFHPGGGGLVYYVSSMLLHLHVPNCFVSNTEAMAEATPSLLYARLFILLYLRS
jgi:hypothetical protein